MSVASGTLPQHFLDAARRGGRRVAMRQKDLGIWQEYSWPDSLAAVREFCLGMVTLGLERGDKVAIVGDNAPEYYWAELAVQAAGGVAVGVFTDSSPSEIEYIADHSDAAFVLASDQEQCDKLIEIHPRLPRVRRVIYWNERGLWNYDDPWLMDFEAVRSLGRTLAEEKPGCFEELVARGRAEDTAVFCYTSGTTGQPKGVMLSHANVIHNFLAVAEVDPFYETDNHLSFLPLAWVSEHVLGVAAHVITGLVVNFPERPETVQANIREIGPQVLLYNSRLWENLASRVEVGIADSNLANRWLYRLFLPVGYRVADLRFARQRVGIVWRVLYALGEAALFAPLRNRLGLSRVRTAYTAGAALSPDAIRFFRALGLNLKNIYGTTEVSGGAATHRDGDIKFESVGRPLPGVEARISSEGEIQIRGHGVFQGYYKDPEATAKALKDGWFHSGDAGHLDEDGHLICLGRMTELLTLAGGRRYPALFIEGRLKFSPYVRDAMTIGGADREHVAALINIDFDNVGRWAERRGLSFTTYVDLSQKPDVYELIRADVERVNRSLPAEARVRRFVLLHKEFDPDEAELTRTRKLRRGAIESRYAELIEAMYADRESVAVRAEVKYRDGRTGVVETDVRVGRAGEGEGP